MDKLRLVGIGMVLALALAIILILGFFFGRAADKAEDLIDTVAGVGDYTNVGVVTVESIRALSELTTIEMIEYTTIEKGDDRGWLNWARGDRLTMFVVARVGAGVNLAQIQEQYLVTNREEGRILLILPPAKISYLEVDNEKSHVYDRDTGFFRTGDKDLERAARLAADEILLQKAIDEGILTLAEDRAILIFEDLFKALGYTDISIRIGADPGPDLDSTP